MTRIIATIIITLGAAFGLTAQTQSDSLVRKPATQADAYLDLAAKADSLMQCEYWAAAADTYRQAMRMQPSNALNPLLMCNMGMCLNEAGDVDGAIATLTDARRMLPGSTIAALNRAQVFRGAGFYDEAYADLSDALDIDSTLVEARLIRGMLALRSDSIDRARADFGILSHMPSDEAHVAAATGNALLYMAVGEYMQAIPPLSTLVEKFPGDADWLGRRALCRILTADPAGASEDIAEAMRYAPEDGELYLYRAMLGKLRYRDEEAKYDRRHAITLGVDADHADAMIQLVEGRR
ncbi:MAG: tetratricopeptide repeat protein [Paramuribaculum sp.]|nr:tetratricopeptide repeat protein [Paramuribaculum sp.]